MYVFIDLFLSTTYDTMSTLKNICAVIKMTVFLLQQVPPDIIEVKGKRDFIRGIKYIEDVSSNSATTIPNLSKLF